MRELELVLKTRSPLVLRASRTQIQFTPTRTHIPGTAIRGALAQHYLRSGGAADDDRFQTLFVRGTVSYGPLFPDKSLKGKDGDEPTLFPGRPLPASAVGCKRFPKRHVAAIGDIVLRSEVSDERPRAIRDRATCPECARRYPDRDPNPRVRLNGYYAEDETMMLFSPDRRMLTSVGINRATNTASQSRLFSVEALEEMQTFRGHIRIHSDDGDEIDALVEALRRLAPGDELRLGRGRSRGKGRLQVCAWDDDAVKSPSLEERLTKFNDTVRALWQQYDATIDYDYFTLTLESPAIVRDARLRPVQPEALDADTVGLPVGVERRGAWADTTVVQGWNAAWRLPKPDMPAIDTGSVFLFHAPTAMRDAVLDRLHEIDSSGIGERRVEGFGRVRVCDPFHYRFEEQTE